MRKECIQKGNSHTDSNIYIYIMDKSIYLYNKRVLPYIPSGKSIYSVNAYINILPYTCIYFAKYIVYNASV